MKTINEKIAAIMELNEKRTQGDWVADIVVYTRDGSNEEYPRLKTKDSFFVISQYGSDMEYNISNDFRFIAQAPTMVSIIQKLQAQLTERENENKHLKATLGAIQSLCCQFEGGVADAIKEFTEAAITKPTEE